MHARLSPLALILMLPLHAAVLGSSKPAEPLTEARVNALPTAERTPWLDYLQRSAAALRADQAALSAERTGLKGPPPAPPQAAAHSLPLDRDAAFYLSPEARHIGDTILSFQMPSGGWARNLDVAGPARLRGQAFTPGESDASADEVAHSSAALDATANDIHFLAHLAAALPAAGGDPYRAAALRGLQFLLAAQFPNGGWPQVWPLEGGSHDALAFNDDVLTDSAQTLALAAVGTHTPLEDFGFVPADLRLQSKFAAARALQCVLATQLSAPAGDPKPGFAIWAEQYDPLTLAPVAARTYEPAAFSANDSAAILQYLMQLPAPSPELVQRIDAAAAWLAAHEINGYSWTLKGVDGKPSPDGKHLLANPRANPLWARFYSLTTAKPIFGDRDKSIHDDVADLSAERRNGYSWYGTWPQRALDAYTLWKGQHPTALPPAPPPTPAAASTP